MENKLDLILENQVQIMNAISQINEISVSSVMILKKQIDKTKIILGQK